VGISETTLYRWINRYDTDRDTRSGASGDELAELARLRTTVRRLEQENEILRRATAYFAKDAPQNDVPAGP
jgi:transposase-like protein